MTNSVGFAGPGQRYTLAMMNALGGDGGYDDGVETTTTRLARMLLAASNRADRRPRRSGGFALGCAMGNNPRMLIRRIARPMLAATFIARGVEALRSPKPAADAARPTLEGLSKLPDPVGPNVPTNAETVAKVTAGVQIGAGLLLATGRLPRLSSAALARQRGAREALVHTPSGTRPIPSARPPSVAHCLSDVGLIGGLIIAAVDTEGRPSLGWRGRRAARKVGERVSGALPSRTPAAR